MTFVSKEEAFEKFRRDNPRYFQWLKDKEEKERIKKMKFAELEEYNKNHPMLTASQRRTAEGVRRALEMQKMFDEGKSMADVASEFDVSRQRIDQITIKYNLNYQVRRLRNREPVITYCADCGKEILQILTPSMRQKKYCSIKCRIRGMTIVGIADMTDEERRDYMRETNRVRTKAYYHAHKHEPVFQARIKKNNARGIARRKEKKLLAQQKDNVEHSD